MGNVKGLGFKIRDSRFKIQDSGFKIQADSLIIGPS